MSVSLQWRNKQTTTVLLVPCVVVFSLRFCWHGNLLSVVELIKWPTPHTDDMEKSIAGRTLEHKLVRTHTHTGTKYSRSWPPTGRSRRPAPDRRADGEFCGQIFDEFLHVHLGLKLALRAAISTHTNQREQRSTCRRTMAESVFHDGRKTAGRAAPLAARRHSFSSPGAARRTGCPMRMSLSCVGSHKTKQQTDVSVTEKLHLSRKNTIYNIFFIYICINQSTLEHLVSLV